MRAGRVVLGIVLGLVALPALVLTAVRLTDPVSEIGIQLQAFTPYAVVPYGLVLVVLAAVAITRSPQRRRRRRWLLVPAALAAAGLGAHLVWLAPLVGGEPRPAAEGADATDEVVLLSSNLYFGRGDAGALVQEAERRQVDVLVVSEVTDRSLAQMRDAGVGDLLPHRAGSPGSAAEGTMVFSRTPVREVAEVAGTTFDNLLVSTAGIRLLAAHPAAPLDPAAWLGDHARLRATVEDLGPDVIAGDLNATLDHAPVRALLDDGYRDSADLTDAGLQPTWPANGLYPLVGLLPPTAPIDHVLLAEGWTATATGTVLVPDTDHLAVISTLAPAA